MAQRRGTPPTRAWRHAATLVALSAPGAWAQDNLSCATVSVEPFPEATRLLGVCSGHGACVEGVCECEPGWTGRSDIISFEGTDCQINVLAVQVMWAALIALGAIVMVRSVPRMRQRVMAFLANRAAARRMGIRYEFSKYRGLVAIVVYLGVTMPGCVAYGLVRIFAPEMRLGLNVLPTILFAVTRTSFYVAVFCFQPMLVSSILTGREQTRHLVELFSRALLVASVLMSLLSFMPCIALALGEQSGMTNVIAWLVFHLGTAVQLVFFGLLSRFLRLEVIKVLANSEDQRVSEVRRLLVGFTNSVTYQCLLQFVLYVMLGLLPYFFGKYDYVVPLNWASYVILGPTLAHMPLPETAASEPVEKAGHYYQSSLPQGTSLGVIGTDASRPAATVTVVSNCGPSDFDSRAVACPSRHLTH